MEYAKTTGFGIITKEHADKLIADGDAELGAISESEDSRGNKGLWQLVTNFKLKMSQRYFLRDCG